jgi:hypothetical protein
VERSSVLAPPVCRIEMPWLVNDVIYCLGLRLSLCLTTEIYSWNARESVDPVEMQADTHQSARITSHLHCSWVRFSYRSWSLYSYPRGVSWFGILISKLQLPVVNDFRQKDMQNLEGFANCTKWTHRSSDISCKCSIRTIIIMPRHYRSRRKKKKT